MINVLYWSNYSSLTQGGQKSLFYILRDIDRTKYRPVLACREEGDLTAAARALGVDVELLELPGPIRLWRIGSIVRFITRLKAVLARYDIKILHSEELRVVFMAFFIKRAARLNTIWHVRVLWDTPVQKIIGLMISDAVVCVSKPVADSFKSSSAKLLVINNGIDTDEFSPNGEKAVSERFASADILIGQVGTLIGHKRTHILIKAAPVVLKLHPDVKFLLVGSGSAEYTAYLEKLAKELGVEKSVIFWGEDTSIKPLLNRLSIVCLLSKNEGLSRTLLEAMALEKPVVVSDIPQNRELVVPGATGLTARLNSPQDTARQITVLLSDRALALRLGKAARERVKNSFSLGITITGIHRLYETLTE